MSLFGNIEDAFLNPPDDVPPEPKTKPRFSQLRPMPPMCISKGCLDFAEPGKLRCWECGEAHADKMASYMEGE